MAGTLDAFHDSERILRQAAATFFDHLSEISQGIILVDRAGRVAWINDRYHRHLAALGFERPEDIIGKPVEDAVPNTKMKQVVDSGQPILLDILENKAGTYVVSRIPIHDDDGVVIGAVGLILYDQIESLKPLLGRLERMQRELTAAQRELAQQRRTRYTFSSFVGNSGPALEVKSRARRAAVLSNNVLLLGETGTGKELLAQAIHAASRRASRPFIAVNVAAVPDTLLEAEFFGVAPGAYTGADRRGRDGKFKLADGGTLFLDEIGDMPLGLQAKLLRVLQEREFEALGSNEIVRVDVRVIAASSRDLSALVAAGSFRSDLFYRLNVLPIRIPPLRDRLEDLEPLCEHLLEQIAAEHDILPRELDRDALAALARLPWRGNIRELRNVLEQASLFWDDIRLTPEAFRGALAGSGSVEDGGGSGGGEREVTNPALSGAWAGTGNGVAGGPVDDGDAIPMARAAPALGGPATALPVPPVTDFGAGLPDPDPDAAPRSLPDRIAALEVAAIREALAATGGNRVQAARRLGIARATLYEKIAGHPALSDFRTVA